jgi:hypothetical protein
MSTSSSSRSTWRICPVCHGQGAIWQTVRPPRAHGSEPANMHQHYAICPLPACDWGRLDPGRSQ